MRRECSASVALVVTDFSTRKALSGLLAAAGVSSHPIGSGLELVSRLRVDRPALAVIDRDGLFCDPSGLVASLAEGRAGLPVTPAVVLSSLRRVSDLQAFLRAGAVDVFTKPILPGAFVCRLREILEVLGANDRGVERAAARGGIEG